MWLEDLIRFRFRKPHRTMASDRLCNCSLHCLCEPAGDINHLGSNQEATTDEDKPAIITPASSDV